jgi:hypothetical protein
MQIIQLKLSYSYSQLEELIIDYSFNLNFVCCRYPDEFESTRIIGNRQFLKAVDLFNSASEEIQGKVDYRHTYLDFSQLEVNVSASTGGQQTVKTCPAAMGFAFAAGTTDGPGAFDFKQGDVKVASTSTYYTNQILASQISLTCC